MSAQEAVGTFKQTVDLFGKGKPLWCDLTLLGEIPPNVKVSVNMLELACDYGKTKDLFLACKIEIPGEEARHGFIRRSSLHRFQAETSA